MTQKSNDKAKRGRPKTVSDEDRASRTTITILRNTHANMVRFAGNEFDVQQVASSFLDWMLEQSESFRLAVMHRRRLSDGDEALRRAFCFVLTDFKNQVCETPGNGSRHLLLDKSEEPTATPALR